MNPNESKETDPPKSDSPPTQQQFISANEPNKVPQVTGSELAPPKKSFDNHRFFFHLTLWGFIVAPTIGYIWEDAHHFPGGLAALMYPITIISGTVYLIVTTLLRRHWRASGKLSTEPEPMTRSERRHEFMITSLYALGFVLLGFLFVLWQVTRADSPY